MVERASDFQVGFFFGEALMISTGAFATRVLLRRWLAFFSRLSDF